MYEPIEKVELQLLRFRIEYLVLHTEYMLYNMACDYYKAIHFFSPSVVVNKNNNKRKLKKKKKKKKTESGGFRPGVENGSCAWLQN